MVLEVMDYTAKKPWLVDRKSRKCKFYKPKTNATQGNYFRIWLKNGLQEDLRLEMVYLNHKQSGGKDNNRIYPPQNKPAQETIKQL